MNKLRIGTRGSQLALWQSERVKALLLERHPSTEIELVKIKTTGDKILDAPLAKIGDKGLFVKEIELALLSGDVDLAVHSAKDMPTELPAELMLAAYLKRDDPSDALISRDDLGLEALPEGAVIGTSSLRRRAQLTAHRPDLKFVDLRGNVDTRLKKLTDEGLDAIVLSGAGLTRLGLEDRITERIPPSVVVPAVGQGLIVVETRRDRTDVREFIDFLNDEATALCVKAERAFSDRIGGGCQVPMGAHAVLEDGRIEITAVVADLNGTTVLREIAQGAAVDGEGIAIALADKMIKDGAGVILDDIRNNC